MGAPTIAHLVEHDDALGLVLECYDRDCGRMIWRECNSFPPGLTLPELRMRARCDWCGSIRGFGVGVSVPRPHFNTWPPTPQVVAAERAWLLDLRTHVLSHPYSHRLLGGFWGSYRPSHALLEHAHHQLGLPMCNLYSNLTTQEAMIRLFKARDRLGNQPPLPGIFPDAEVPIVRINREGETALTRARWGWNKAKFGWVTNVRNLDAWPWKHVIEETRQRCLVPATSFAEYHPTETIPGKSGKPIKAATWFRLISDDEERPPFAFAGFMRRWSWEKDGLRKTADEPLRESDTQVIAMAFLTTDPNAVVEPIHPKAMPVILRPEEYRTWLHGDATAAADLQRPLPDDALEIAFIGAKEDGGEV